MRMPFLCAAAALAVIGCSGKNPVASSATATVVVRSRAQTPPLLAKAAYTTFDTLVVQVFAAEMDTVTLRRRVSGSPTFMVDTLTRIPAGKGRKVRAWTVDREGRIVNESGEIRIGTIEEGTMTTIDLYLEALRGSLSFQLLTPLAIKTVQACFTATGGEEVCASASPVSGKVSLVLDYIPVRATGTVTITGHIENGDTMYFATYPWIPGTVADTTLRPVFSERMGALEISFDLQRAPVAAVLADMGSLQQLPAEVGPLVITEIMYNADKSEYIELFNPLAVDTTFDTLIVQIDNKKPLLFEKVTVKARGYLVISRSEAPWGDIWPASQNDLDLTSTSGNWIRLYRKDGTLMDVVALPPRINALGWPNMGGSRSAIVCTADPLTPAANNFGLNWAVATSAIEGDNTGLRGTPGYAGL